jgi:hypothetical protein
MNLLAGHAAGWPLAAAALAFWIVMFARNRSTESV